MNGTRTDRKFLELKKILKKTENKENDRPVLEAIPEEKLTRAFGRKTGLTDTTNRPADRPVYKSSRGQKPVNQTRFS